MKRILAIIILISLSSAQAQSTISWTNISSSYNLPDGVKIFSGTRSSPVLKAWYIDVDLNKNNLGIKAYLNPVGKESLTNFSQRFNTIASINGGYFDVSSGTSYSAVVQPDVVLGKNINSVVRDSKTYYLTRSFFGIKDTRELAVDWIYHFGSRVIDIYRYQDPTPNSPGNPAPSPNVLNGLQYYELLTGIGGGPTLVKNSQSRITYDEEVFFGSGVGLTNGDPRTAVGYTANNHVIMFVADGRQTGISEGVSLTELSQIMINLGCKEAMNLDGGGSTTMAVRNTLINTPSDGSQRLIPTMLAVVNIDSIPLLPKPYLNKKIDTGDSSDCFTFGNWQTAYISGFWGNTPSIAATGGNGNNYVVFNLNLPKSGLYDIFMWWVAATNRAKNTPVVIKHKFGTDTIRVNQNINGTKWNKIGTFTFNGNTSDQLIITNTGVALDSFIVADALRILSYDSTLSFIETNTSLPVSSQLFQNYPNPFNPETYIRYSVIENSFVRIKIFNSVGSEISVLENSIKSPGVYEIKFTADNLQSGIYFYQLQCGNVIETKKMLLLK